MSKKRTPRDTRTTKNGEPAPESEQPPQTEDKFMEVLRDLPRMRTIVREGDKDPTSYRQIPLMSRLGAFIQGCGVLVLLVIGLPAVLVASAFGFYLWGPGLLVSGAVVLVAAVVGTWRGNWLPMLIGTLVLGFAWGVEIWWRSLLTAVTILAPFGGEIAGIFGLVFYVGFFMVMPLGFIVLIIYTILDLVFWHRLLLPSRRILTMWAVLLALVIAVPFVMHVYEQGQRETWLEDHKRDWTANAQSATLLMGGNTNVALGHTFAQRSDDDNDDIVTDTLETRMAELEAILEAGSSPVRVLVSGDSLLEAEVPRLYDAEESETKLAEQLARETQYMDLLAESGMALFLADSSYSPYLVEWSSDEDAKILWSGFASLHTERIQYYAELYQPAYYAVICEPNGYDEYSQIKLPGEGEADEDQINLEAWLEHTEELIAAVKEVSPNTQVGVTVAIDSDFDLDYYEQVLDMDGISFITLELFQQGAFERIEDMLDEHGHPADHDKQLWISETWYGFCLAPQRSMKLDSLWLETVVAFAAKERISAVLPTNFGCFLQAGGTLIEKVGDLNARTGVWRTWKTLVETWQPVSAES